MSRESAPRIPALAISLVFCAVPGWNVFGMGDAGTSSASFLRLGTDARATAMGEAHAALGSGAAALAWNPAGLGSVVRPAAASSYASYLGQAQHKHLGLAVPFKRLGGAVGLEVTHMSFSSIKETDASGNELGSFRPYHLALGAGYGRDWGAWSLGAGARYLNSRILRAASTLAADAGIRYRVGARLSLAASLQHLGPGLRFEAERAPLPMTLRLGGAWHAQAGWVLASDLALGRDRVPHLHLGAELPLYQWRELRLLGRLGYQVSTLRTRGIAGPAAGFGLGLRGFSIDYALGASGELGLTHRMTLGYSWAQKKRADPPLVPPAQGDVIEKKHSPSEGKLGSPKGLSE